MADLLQFGELQANQYVFVDLKGDSQLMEALRSEAIRPKRFLLYPKIAHTPPTAWTDFLAITLQETPMKFSNHADGIIDRIRHSSIKELRESTYLGMAHVDDPYPVFVPDSFWQHHFWSTGGTRSGKSSRFMYSLAKQRIQRNIGPVAYIDLKGEDWLFHAIKKVAEAAGRRFLWFTNVDYFSTYLFSFLGQRLVRNLTLAQLAQLLLNALNLWHGFIYGGSYFSAQSRGAIAAALKFKSTGDPHNAWMPTKESKRIKTFSQLRAAVKEVVESREEFRGAHELLMILEDLGNMLQVDCSHRDLPQTAVDNAINIADLLVPDSNGKYPVVYLYLRAGTELVGVSQIAKLFVYGLIVARKQAEDFYKMGRQPHNPPVVPVFIDEIQLLADASIRNALEQASGYGIHFVLAHQDVSQLKQTNIDLLPTVFENAGCKIVFSARDAAWQKTLMEIGGERVEHVPSFAVSHEALANGEVSYEHALKVLNGRWAAPSVTQRRVPRIDRNTLIELNNTASRALFIPPQADSIADFGGYPMLLDMGFHMSQKEYEAFNSMGWPEPTPETIVPADYRADS